MFGVRKKIRTQMSIKKPHSLTLIIIFLILLGLFFGLYQFFLLYFEEQKADKIADYIILPILTILSLFIIISEYVSTKKRWRFSFKDFIKFVGSTILGVAVAYILFIRPVISGFILFINTNIGQQNEIDFQGLIIDKREFNSSKSGEHWLTIKDYNTNKIYKFETFGFESKKYNINDRFEKKMKKGCLGLLYSKN